MVSPRIPACLALLLLCAPLAGATTDTWTDASGDQGLLASSHYDILSGTVASDGTDLTLTFHMAALGTHQRAVRYDANLYDAGGNGIVANCIVGHSLDPTVAQGCTCSHGTSEPVDGVAIAVAVPCTLGVDAASGDVTVTFTYSDLGVATGDLMTVVDFATEAPPGIFLPEQPPLPAVVGDQLFVNSDVTLA